MNTAEQGLPEDIVRYIEECRRGEHPESTLIAVLQRIQHRFGYLPKESMDEVSARLRVPATAGLVTAYGPAIPLTVTE